MTESFEQFLEESDKRNWPTKACRIAWKSYSLVPRKTDPMSWLLYVRGYRTAADRLVETILEKDLDFLVYPILFLYRHYIEVGLKHLYLLYGLYMETDTQADLSKVSNSHSLKVLWGLVKARVLESQDVSDEDDIRPLEKAALRLHELDASSTSTRYPVTRDGNASITERAFLLGELKDLISEAAPFIEGSYDWVMDRIEFQAEQQHELAQMFAELDF